MNCGVTAELYHSAVARSECDDWPVHTQTVIPVRPVAGDRSTVTNVKENYSIDDLPEGIISTVWLFADDIVMYLTIASQTDSHKLQAYQTGEKMAKAIPPK